MATNLKTQQRRIIAAFVVFMLAATSFGVAGATQWQPRQGCSYTIPNGDTLNAISRLTGTPVAEMVNVNPSINHPDRIPAGAVIDTCREAYVEGRPLLVAPAEAVAVPPRLTRWAEVLIWNMPDHATDADLEFLVAISGPESGHCGDGNVFNHGDAGGNGWLGSYGCAQIRVNSNWQARNEPMRNLDWLKESLHHEAQAAWWIYFESWGGTQAWGPAKHSSAVGGTKLPPGGAIECGGAVSPQRCRGWWDVANLAIDEAVEVMRAKSAPIG